MKNFTHLSATIPAHFGIAKGYLSLAFLCLLLSWPTAGLEAQSCGIDIHIANDNSGSVDALENRQSREFASQLGLSFTPLGTGNTESRVSIGTWANTGTFQEYSFPSVGQNYTTSLSDVLSYASAPRTLRGGTNVYDALRRAAQVIDQNPVSGRTAPKVIVLMTDASCNQISGNIVSLATFLKQQGVYIVVLAIDAASTCTILQGSNVASPGGYFAAGDYQTLANDAITFINGIQATACGTSPEPPAFDLTVGISNFEITGCNPGPATASANYIVTNNSAGEDFNGNLQISFYNGDPTLPGTQYLFTEDAGTQSIPLGGGTFNGTVSDPSLVNTATLYAVVNFDGGQAGNGVPLSYSNLSNQLTVPDEGDVSNNISLAGSRADGMGCLPFANLDVQVTNSGVGCDDKVIYTVQVCNTGTGDAVDFNMETYAPIGATLLDSMLVGTDPFISDPMMPGSVTLPAGACATYQLTYDISGAGAGPYDYSVDVTASPSAGPSTSATLTSDKAQSSISAPDDLSNCGLGLRNSPNTGGLCGTIDPRGAVVEFDLSPYAGQNIISATFIVKKSTDNSDSDANAVPYIQRAIASWTEGACNGAVPAATGDYGSQSVPVPGTTAAAPQLPINTIVEFDVTTLVSEWLAGTHPNFGLVINPGSAGACAETTYGFYSDDAANPADRPQLVLEFAGASDDPVRYSPNTAFALGGGPGSLNGFDGTQNSTDDLTYSGSSPACPMGDQVTVSVAMTGDGDCPGSFGTATITINNQSGLTLSNTLLNLDLTGTSAAFSGEPYDKTNGIILAEPNIFDPAYPNVPNALSEKTGMQQLAIYTLPAGTSTFELDYEIGTTATGLSAEVAQLPTSVNGTGTASGSNSITPATLAGISGTCPADVTTAATTLSLNYTVTNAASVAWSSGSGGSFADPAAATTTYTINDTDRANGYVDLALTALSPQGCDSLITCRVLITGVSYDYGDAPATYDLSDDAIPIAAAATLSPDIFLGQTAPDTEAAALASADATGDGAEDDGLLSTVLTYPEAGQSGYTIAVEVTNNSGSDAFLYGYIDWNGDGDFVSDADERSVLITVPTGGLSTQNISFNVPASYTSPAPTFLRLRLSTDELTAGNPFGPAANGEVEDYEVSFAAAEADLAITKIVDNPTPNVGDNVVFTLTVTNNGPNTATGVEVTDNLPSGYTYVSDDGSGAYNSGTGLWTIGNLANGGTATLNITATVNATGDYVNTASVMGNENDPDTNNNTDDEPTAPVAQTDLAITKTVDNPTPDVGDNVVFTLSVTNNGPAAATGVEVSDLLPSGYTYVSDDGGGAYASGTGLWTIGNLAASATATLNITATVNATGDYLNTATVTGNENDPDTNNNTDDEPTAPVAQTDLGITKTVDNPTPDVGDNVVFTLTVTNNGPAAATGVEVSDLLPSGYTYVSDDGGGDYASGTGLWTIGNLAASATATLNITATVLTTGDYLNIARVSGNENDPDPTNNVDAAEVTPNCTIRNINPNINNN
ncbi:DNRLRE domain-containing protein [Phaeodactylibacter luteus]|nr:DNRLRE domain-containing protein [Phaeodactylibacter luteus]